MRFPQSSLLHTIRRDAAENAETMRRSEWRTMRAVYKASLACGKRSLIPYCSSNWLTLNPDSLFTLVGSVARITYFTENDAGIDIETSGLSPTQRHIRHRARRIVSAYLRQTRLDLTARVPTRLDSSGGCRHTSRRIRVLRFGNLDRLILIVLSNSATEI